MPSLRSEKAIQFAISLVVSMLAMAFYNYLDDFMIKVFEESTLPSSKCSPGMVILSKGWTSRKVRLWKFEGWGSRIRPATPITKNSQFCWTYTLSKKDTPICLLWSKIRVLWANCNIKGTYRLHINCKQITYKLPNMKCHE